MCLANSPISEDVVLCNEGDVFLLDHMELVYIKIIQHSALLFQPQE